MASPGTNANTNKEPVWCVFNGVVLGFVEEGDVTVTPTMDWVDRRFHQTGTFILDSYFNGMQLDIQVTIAEVLNVDNWVVAFLQGQRQQDTSTPTKKRFAFSTIADPTLGLHVGKKATDEAAELKLIPGASGSVPSTETDRDFFIPKAFCRNVGDILFSVSANQSLPLTFSVLYDHTKTDGTNFAIFGREAGTWAAY